MTELLDPLVGLGVGLVCIAAAPLVLACVGLVLGAVVGARRARRA